jgi:hypothetical protein
MFSRDRPDVTDGARQPSVAEGATVASVPFHANLRRRPLDNGGVTERSR